MFVSSGQFKNLVILFGAGLLSGAVLEVFLPLKRSKNKIVAVIFTVIYFVSSFTLYVAVKNYGKIGDFRLYMPVSFLVGNYLSYRLFYKSLAILDRKVYNIFTKALISLKKVVFTLFDLFGITKRRTRYARGKAEKVNSFLGRNGGFASVYTSKYNGLPNDFDKESSSKNRRAKRTNRVARGGKSTNGR